MRKKVLLLAGCVLASVFMLTGCGESYPQISVYRSEWGEDNLDIGIGNDYKYDRYTKEDTSNGCSVTIYFTERKNK